ncbi:LacI family transcriptional regulator [Marinobacterium zhoushanense]|uniref:LacI family transcriptional regulator n=1 Tax=Marinobacterium zhoushanense TaxID=1679163 RepID=A0ABQ1KEX2_9GAMM|nr:LacI family DNA-binding transcriptional regulator [Marinobacterium zhoushanense]GGB94037.1 LacI family transcriptional regulator [Marinobacterium zhoushanense]
MASSHQPRAKHTSLQSTTGLGKSATIHEIAEAAGVSIASVSRALNGKPGISEKLRQHILKISEEINYRPSTAARQLIGGKNAVVAISMREHGFELRPYFTLLYMSLVVELGKQGKTPVFFSYSDSEKIHRQAGSAILLGEEVDEYRPEMLARQGIPYIRIDQWDTNFSISTDGVDGLYQATRYLIDKGCTRIAFIGEEIGRKLDFPTLPLPVPEHRILGYHKALDEAGMKPARIINIPFAYNSTLTAYRHLRSSLKSQPLDFDAIACESDEQAIGCITALEDEGIKVPDQVSVTGFDDLPLLAKDLTTVRQDIPQLAAEAVKLLNEAINGAAPHRVILPVTLIRRESA